MESLEFVNYMEGENALELLNSLLSWIGKACSVLSAEESECSIRVTALQDLSHMLRSLTVHKTDACIQCDVLTEKDLASNKQEEKKTSLNAQEDLFTFNYSEYNGAQTSSANLPEFNTSREISADHLQAKIKQEKLEEDIGLDSLNPDFSNSLYFDGISFSMSEDNTIVTSTKKPQSKQTKAKLKNPIKVKEKQNKVIKKKRPESKNVKSETSVPLESGGAMVEGVKTEQTVQNIKKVKKESKKKNPGKIRECKQCPGLQFLKLKEYKAHMLEKHPPVKKTVEIKECGLCPGMEFSVKEYRAHMLDVHFTKESDHVVCKLCGKQIRHGINKWETHLSAKHGMPAVKSLSCLCNTCGKFFKTRRHLRGHLETHFGVNKFCEICKAGPFTKMNLKHHRMRVHKKTRNYMCEICSKRYGKKVDLDAHYNSHTGARPWSCPYCFKQFGSRVHLQRHQKQHVTEKSWVCGDCARQGKEYATFQRSNMKVHMRVHSGVEYSLTELHSCPLCCVCFHQRASLDKHKLQHPDFDQVVENMKSERNADYMRHQLWRPDVNSTESEHSEQPSATPEPSLHAQMPFLAESQKQVWQNAPSLDNIQDRQSIFPTNQTVMPM